MSIERDIARLGGVARTEQLLALGNSRHTLAKLTRSGALVRPRVGWLALPDADPQLLFAAHHGVILSCITEAKRRNLWVLTEGLHVAVPKRGHKINAPAGTTVHWRKPLVPRAAGALSDPLENMLDCVAACQPHEAALTIWESALQKGLTNYLALQSLPLRGNAKQLLELASPYSDSGLETLFLRRLSWLKIPIRSQAWVHHHRVDFLIGDRLIVQIDGATHTGKQRRSDIAHDAALSLQGYTVIRVDYYDVVHDWPSVQDRILSAIARGQHLARS